MHLVARNLAQKIQVVQCHFQAKQLTKVFDNLWAKEMIRLAFVVVPKVQQEGYEKTQIGRDLMLQQLPKHQDQVVQAIMDVDTVPQPKD